MNKVEKLNQDIEDYRKKKEAQIKKIQSKCKHKNIERMSDYCGINEQCKDCNKWLR